MTMKDSGEREDDGDGEEGGKGVRRWKRRMKLR